MTALLSGWYSAGLCCRFPSGSGDRRLVPFLAFGYWNDWFQARLYIDSNSLKSLQAMLYSIQADLKYLTQNPTATLTSSSALLASMPQESVTMAIAFVVAVPIACVYPFFQKYFISGLTVGAVKG